MDIFNGVKEGSRRMSFVHFLSKESESYRLTRLDAGLSGGDTAKGGFERGGLGLDDIG